MTFHWFYFDQNFYIEIIIEKVVCTVFVSISLDLLPILNYIINVNFTSVCYLWCDMVINVMVFSNVLFNSNSNRIEMTAKNNVYKMINTIVWTRQLFENVNVLSLNEVLVTFDIWSSVVMFQCNFFP